MEAAAIENNNDNDNNKNVDNKGIGEVHSLGYLILLDRFESKLKDI